jgi:hypothetical protein
MVSQFICKYKNVFTSTKYLLLSARFYRDVSEYALAIECLNGVLGFMPGHLYARESIKEIQKMIQPSQSVDEEEMDGEYEEMEDVEVEQLSDM